MSINTHSLARITRMVNNDPKLAAIQAIIVEIIMAGGVVGITKVKWAKEGGKQFVSVGPYRTATSPAEYAMISGKYAEHLDRAPAPVDVAQAFIAFVGRPLARRAVRELLAREC